MEETEMRGIDIAFQCLQPIAFAQRAAGEDLAFGEEQRLDRWERRRFLACAHIGPDDAVALDRAIGLGLDFVGEGMARLYIGHVEAIAVDIEFPAMIDAADAAFLV